MGTARGARDKYRVMIITDRDRIDAMELLDPIKP